MKTAKTSKRALLCSVLSIALCLSMLIGTTFAWFTDTATTSVNQIKAGTLDVELVDENGGALPAQLTWQKAAGHTDEDVLWEPGCTYKTQGFKIKNNGTLALKYTVVVNGVEGDTGLLKVIDFDLVTNDGEKDTVLEDNTSHLSATQTSDTLYLKAHMDETAGNEYQGKTLDGVTITVYATQYTEEYDSTGNQYDAKADMTPDNLDKMVTANVTKTAVSGEPTVLKNADSTVTATVPAGAVTPGTELTLTVAPAQNPIVTVKSNQGVQAYNISVTGLAADNAAPVEVNLFVGKGLSHVTLYHNNVKVDGAVYDAVNGYITFTTTSFSPFDVVYDAPVATVDGIPYGDIKAAMAAGGDILVPADVETNNSEDTVAARISITKPSTLTLNGKIKTPDDMGKNNTNFTALIVDADTTINATENGGIDTGLNGGYGLNVRKSATLTINGGYYYGGGTAVQVQEGTLIINGGTFACEPYGEPYGYKYLINCIDAAFTAGTAKIIITGGTFVNFNPADVKGEPQNPTSYLAKGYTVQTEVHGTDTWYTVVKAN